MLELTDISISAKKRVLFSSLSIKVKKGEIRCIMGPSGCGKSTLLAAISGSLNEHFTFSGKICLNDRVLNELPLQKRKVGILFQDDLLFPHLNVAGNLAFALPPSISKEEKNTLIKKSLSQAGLAGFENRDIATLSGGQKARISLLRTLLAEPDAILLDEPFSKLDEELRASFRQFVYKQVKQMSIPALLVTHNKQDILKGNAINLTSFSEPF